MKFNLICLYFLLSYQYKYIKFIIQKSTSNHVWNPQKSLLFPIDWWIIMKLIMHYLTLITSCCLLFLKLGICLNTSFMIIILYWNYIQQSCGKVTKAHVVCEAWGSSPEHLNSLTNGEKGVIIPVPHRRK